MIYLNIRQLLGSASFKRKAGEKGTEAKGSICDFKMSNGDIQSTTLNITYQTTFYNLNFIDT